MNITYDSKADVLYIQLREGKIAKSEEVRPGLYLDQDESDRPVGIKLLKAGEFLGENPEVSVEWDKGRSHVYLNTSSNISVKNVRG